MMDNESLPNMDDVQSSEPTEQSLLDAVMANSPIMEEVGVPLPTEEEVPEVPEESDEEDQESEELVSEDEEVEVEEEAGEEGEDDQSTQEPEIYTADDLDLDAQVTVKVDGEEMNVSFGDLIKGYQTDQSLSSKGRELGEARKQLDEEREQKLQEITQMSDTMTVMLGQSEQVFAKQYADLESKIDKARADGDTYEVNELKDKREQVQKKYWDVRNRREQITQAVQEQQQKLAQEQWEAQLKNFDEKIPEMIPDFNDEVAQSIRQFAIDEGINPNLLDEITDPVIVKFVDDYRRLKQGVTKGAAKRKAVPAKRAPVKKAKPVNQKKEEAAKMVKARAFREDASEADQMAFLRQHASNSLTNL